MKDSDAKETSRRELLALSGGLGIILATSCSDGAEEGPDAFDYATTALSLSSSNFEAIETLSDLAGLTVPSGGATEAYYVAGDEGGAFIWDGSSQAAHDGALVIQPTSNPASGRWLRQFTRGRVSVKWFGAKGNDLADDTTAIQAALDAAEDNGDVTEIYFPPGTYKVSSSLEIPVACQGLQVLGSGWGETQPNTTLRNVNNSGDALFTTAGTGTLAFFRAGNFRCHQSSSAGYFFAFGHLTVHLELFRIHFNVSNEGAGAVIMDGVENHMNWIHDCKAVGSNMTVPMYHWKGPSNSNLTTTTFERLTTNTPGSSEPQILVENYYTTASPGFAFKSLNIEQPDGGGVHLYGITSASFDNCITSDTASQTAPVYYIGKIASSLSLLGATFIECHSYIGTQTYPNLVLEDTVGGVDPGPVTCIGGRFSWVDPGPFSSITMINTSNTGYVTGGKPPMRIQANSLVGVQGIGGEDYSRTGGGVDRSRHFSGVAVFNSSSACEVRFALHDVGGQDPEDDVAYEVLLGPCNNETIWVDQGSKTKTTFELRSSNTSSQARVAWMIVRTQFYS